MTTELNLYAERDHAALDAAGNYYCRHVDRMTRESLHAKSDIAAELGWRDMEIDRLRARVAELERALRDTEDMYTERTSQLDSAMESLRRKDQHIAEYIAEANELRAARDQAWRAGYKAGQERLSISMSKDGA